MALGRREFICAAGAWAVSPALAATRARPRLAVHVYGVRDLCEQDLVGTLKAARRIGFEGVETGRFYGRSAADWRSICADIGLELVACQIYPFCLTEPELAKTIDFCKTAGCRRLSTAWFKGSADNLGDWQLAINVINHAAEVCAREGIAVAYHNHDQEFRTRFGGKTVWEWMWEGEGKNPELNQLFPVSRFSPLVQQEFDPNWCALAGEDAQHWLKRHARRNKTVHVSLDSPKCDWPELVATAALSGVEWLAVKPVPHSAQLEELRKDYDYLKGLIA